MSHTKKPKAKAFIINNPRQVVHVRNALNQLGFDYIETDANDPSVIKDPTDPNANANRPHIDWTDKDKSGCLGCGLLMIVLFIIILLAGMFVPTTH